MLVGAPVPLTGRYAVQGRQVRAGLELWAAREGAELAAEDDRSEPELSARLHEALHVSGCRFVVGPYGSDSTRACAEARRGAVVWNHGAAADDVQRMPGVVSVATPASRYLTALAAAIAGLRPGARIALAIGRGRFARFAARGLEGSARAPGVEFVGRFTLTDSHENVVAMRPDAVIACGALEEELALFALLDHSLPEALVGGVSPGLADFPRQLGRDPEGYLAPVQWHPDVASTAELGPTAQQVVADSRAAGHRQLDYVGAQAYAAALIADHCTARAPGDPLSAAKALVTTTFFGAFGLDPASGVQRRHRLSVVRWSGGRQEPLRVAWAP